MKRITMAMMLCCLALTVTPGYAFIDYLFGGSSNKGAIDNSAVGDLRSWWTGNPVYQFNPYYTGQTNTGAQGQQGAQQQPAMQQPNVTFIPSQGAPMSVGQQYGQPAPYAAPPQQYAAPPQQPYPAAPPQGYQQPSQAYQPPAQGYAPQGYPEQQAYPAAPQGYQPQPPQQLQPSQQQQQYYNGENGMYGGAGFVPGQQQ